MKLKRLWTNFAVSVVMVLMVLMVLALAACGNNSADSEGQNSKQTTEGPQKSSPSASESPPSPSTSPDSADNGKPVTLTMYIYTTSITDVTFQSLIADPVQAKFPNVTLKALYSAKGNALPEVLVAGTPIDLVLSNSGLVNEFIDGDLALDMNTLVKGNNVDLSRFDQSALNWIKSYGTQGELYGLPAMRNGSALFYNKDIFDKFGVSYPTDGMTWDEVLDLSRDLYRTESETVYRPLYAGRLWQFATQLEPAYIDKSTLAPTMDSDKWKKAADYFKKIADVNQIESTPINQLLGTFFKEKTLAMYAGVTDYSFSRFSAQFEANESFNWGLVSYPHFPETAGTSYFIDVLPMLISSTSKFQSQAFEVLNYLTSDESQMRMSKSGFIPVITSEDVQKQFGADDPALVGKNLEAIFKTIPAARDPETVKYETAIRAVVNKEEVKLTSGLEDVNSFLRSVNDQARQAISALDGK